MLEFESVVFDDMVELIMALKKMYSERFWVIYCQKMVFWTTS